MKQGYWGFLAGMMFMAATIAFEIWGLTPHAANAGAEYGAGVAVDTRDC